MIKTIASLSSAFTACLDQLWYFKKDRDYRHVDGSELKSMCVPAYLCALLGGVQSHHVVPEKLLKELHLGHAEVEVQAAGHVYLQRVATHHHLLHGDEGERTGGT